MSESPRQCIVCGCALGPWWSEPMCYECQNGNWIWPCLRPTALPPSVLPVGVLHVWNQEEKPQMPLPILPSERKAWTNKESQ